jgi:hydrogenase expression/formation protein HypC
MCLAIPMRVVTVEETKGTVELGGVEQPVNLTFTPEVEPGEYVVVHAGFALERLDEAEAQRTIVLLNELAASEGAE